MFTLEDFINKLRDTAQDLEATAHELTNLANALEKDDREKYELLTDREYVSGFMEDWCLDSGSLSFDNENEIIMLDLINNDGMIDLDDIEE